MPVWIIYALASMLFAGFTSILAKYGLKGLNADIGLGVRTASIFIIISLFVIIGNKLKYISTITPNQYVFLILSGITTSLSWICYYRAMKDGLVSYVAAIDKGSIVVTLFLSFLLLKEPFTPKTFVAMGLIVAGIIVLLIK